LNRQNNNKFANNSGLQYSHYIDEEDQEYEDNKKRISHEEANQLIVLKNDKFKKSSTNSIDNNEFFKSSSKRRPIKDTKDLQDDLEESQVIGGSGQIREYTFGLKKEDKTFYRQSTAPVNPQGLRIVKSIKGTNLNNPQVVKGVRGGKFE